WGGWLGGRRGGWRGGWQGQDQIVWLGDRRQLVGASTLERGDSLGHTVASQLVAAATEPVDLSPAKTTSPDPAGMDAGSGRDSAGARADSAGGGSSSGASSSGGSSSGGSSSGGGSDGGPSSGGGGSSGG